MCAGRPEQSDQNHPRGHYKYEYEDNAHRGTQPPRNATPRREDGFVPSLVPTTIQLSEILHERFCLHSYSQRRYQKNARVFFCFAKGRGTHLATTRVVHALDLAGLRADGG